MDSANKEDKSNMHEKESLELIYPALIGEINRYRDWPIRVLTFTSALHFGVIGLFLLKETPPIIPTSWKCVLSFFLLTLGIYTVYYFYRCHKNYLEARNTQVMIQKKLKIDEWYIGEEKVFPQKWFEKVCVSGFERIWGWGFYCFYASGMTICAILVLWVKITT